ncbi:MAG: alpha/beta hydrolase [Sphingomonadales bacterium]|nr:alpha/beta hydrolase [Sphingomonadales bacterium]MDE2168138.1 alpha/beta hydrolase [Sphingomonadales bacterium]
MFNALMPKDDGGEAIAHGLPFGPNARQRLDIYGPGSRAFQPLPVIIFFYGGSWSSGTRAGYAFLARALASGGFIVVIPDYRLVPHVVYPAFLQDNAAAVHWVREHIGPYGGDPDRIILAGHSAGAYNAAMLALDPRWLGEDRRAVKGLIGLAGPYDFLPFKGPVVESAFPRIARPELTQPVHYAQAGSPPAFLASGDRDHVVLPANSDALALALRHGGAFVERKRYPGVGHVGLVTAIARPLRGKAPVLADMMVFAHKVTS